uniref:Cytochrome P450 n=1 Tax=Oryza brachyantha TaxID=4533 RepID=J3LRB3_ORYBR
MEGAAVAAAGGGATPSSLPCNIALTAGLAVLAAAWLLASIRRRNTNAIAGGRGAGGRLPPGSRGLPFLGETLQFFAQSPSLELHGFFKRRMDRYGPVFRTNIVGEDLIVSLDPEVNNFVFQQEGRLFQLWYPYSVMRIFGIPTIATTLGPLHRLMRSLVLRFLGPEALRQSVLHEVQKTAEAALLSWLDQPSIECKEALSSMIFSVTAKKIISYDSETSDGMMWKHYDTFFGNLITFPLCIPGTAFHKCMQGRKNVMKMLKELFDERRGKTARRPAESIDFIDVLLEELKQEKPALSESTALELIFLLLFASFETIASATTAVLTFLTDNPEALQELTEEHDYIQKRRADRSSKITWEEYKSMKFTSHGMFRTATEDVHIKGFAIPKGSKIMVCSASVHLNPAVYKDPNIFNPWRWKDTAEPAGGGSKDFMAFGGGVRLCVGSDFAKLHMAVFLHCLVTKYRWKAIKGGKMTLSPGLRFPEGFRIQLLPKA